MTLEIGEESSLTIKWLPRCFGSLSRSVFRGGTRIATRADFADFAKRDSCVVLVIGRQFLSIVCRRAKGAVVPVSDALLGIPVLRIRIVNQADRASAPHGPETPSGTPIDSSRLSRLASRCRVVALRGGVTQNRNAQKRTLSQGGSNNPVGGH